MRHFKDIDGLSSAGRPPLSAKEREKLRQEKIQQQRESNYQLLAELCRLGESDAAKLLANRNYNWGYEIVDGEVRERLD